MGRAAATAHPGGSLRAHLGWRPRPSWRRSGARGRSEARRGHGDAASPTDARAKARLRLLGGIASAAAFLLVTVVLVPEHVFGAEVLPESWDAFVDLGVLFSLGALLLRRPGATSGEVPNAAVHGLLLGLVIAAAAGAIAAFVGLWHQGGSVVSFGAVGLLVLAVVPLRTFVASRADTVLFGSRDEPYQVLAGLGRRLEASGPPDEVLPGVVRTIAVTLDVAYVAIELEGAAGVVAVTGLRTGQLARFPLDLEGERLGSLVVGARPGTRLTAADRRLLADLGHQVAVTARTAQLVRDLRRINVRIVATREEERRRIRRDLHDGLGPVLAGIAMAAQAAQNLVPTDPAAAAALLERIGAAGRSATAEIRDLIEALPPLALERLGLVEALRERLTGLAADGEAPGAVAVRLETSGPMTGLPAEIELAAYRIALEAFTNVLRHAQARHCDVRIVNDGRLNVTIVDDGVGIEDDATPGIGLVSMAERAAGVGGELVVRRGSDGGTEVRASLPVIQ